MSSQPGSTSVAPSNEQTLRNMAPGTTEVPKKKINPAVIAVPVSIVIALAIAATVGTLLARHHQKLCFKPKENAVGSQDTSGTSMSFDGVNVDLVFAANVAENKKLLESASGVKDWIEKSNDKKFGEGDAKAKHDKLDQETFNLFKKNDGILFTKKDEKDVLAVQKLASLQEGKGVFHASVKMQDAIEKEPTTAGNKDDVTKVIKKIELKDEKGEELKDPGKFVHAFNKTHQYANAIRLVLDYAIKENKKVDVDQTAQEAVKNLSLADEVKRYKCKMNNKDATGLDYFNHLLNGIVKGAPVSSPPPATSPEAAKPTEEPDKTDPSQKGTSAQPQGQPSTGTSTSTTTTTSQSQPSVK